MKELNLQNILNWIKSNLEENKLNIYGHILGFDPNIGTTNFIRIIPNASKYISNQGFGGTHYIYSKYYKNDCLVSNYNVSPKVFDAFTDEDYKSKVINTDKCIPYQVSIVFESEPQLIVTLNSQTVYETKETEVFIPFLGLFKKKYKIIHSLGTTKFSININHGTYNKSYESTPEDILLYASLFDSYNAKVKELIETKELLDANLLLTRLS